MPDCPTCGTPVAAGTDSCSNCGSKVVDYHGCFSTFGCCLIWILVALGLLIILFIAAVQNMEFVDFGDGTWD